MSDAIFLAEKAAGRLKIGDSQELNQSGLAEAMGIRLTRRLGKSVTSLLRRAT